MKTIILAFFITFCSFPAISAAPNSIGIVKIVSDESAVVRNGKSLKITPGMKLYEGDVVKTDTQGSVGLVFEDDTIISLGPNSHIVIESFLFEPVEKRLGFVTRMIQGTVSFISGQIARLAPNSVRFEIPTATIGMRGTHFLVKVHEK